MPFQGEAVALPITMLTQKRGGRTKAAPAPEAMVIQTSGELPLLASRHDLCSGAAALLVWKCTCFYAPASHAECVSITFLRADGQQWALGAEGVSGIPESHRREVTDLLTAQFNFFAAALGKTVFERDTKRGGRRR